MQDALHVRMRDGGEFVFGFEIGYGLRAVGFLQVGEPVQVSAFEKYPR